MWLDSVDLAQALQRILQSAQIRQQRHVEVEQPIKLKQQIRAIVLDQDDE